MTAEQRKTFEVASAAGIFILMAFLLMGTGKDPMRGSVIWFVVTLATTAYVAKKYNSVRPSLRSYTKPISVLLFMLCALPAFSLTACLTCFLLATVISTWDEWVRLNFLVGPVADHDPLLRRFLFQIKLQGWCVFALLGVSIYLSPNPVIFVFLLPVLLSMGFVTSMTYRLETALAHRHGIVEVIY